MVLLVQFFNHFSVYPSLELESDTVASRDFRYYRRHLLQFGGPAVDLSQETVMRILAWVARYFVPHVAESPRDFWTSMLNGVPLVTYMTHSDLAFAVLVLEHHLMKWRHLVQVELETGTAPSSDYCRRASGLFYNGGIAGDEAKRRFDELNVYFYNHFYSRAAADREKNVILLQRLVDGMAKGDASEIRSKKLTSNSSSPDGDRRMDEIKDDILHRVFYYMFM